MQKGDIVLVSFPFTNLKGTKSRPAVILFVGDRDVVVSFITSKPTSPSNTDLVLIPEKENGLKKISTLKVDKIATLEKDLLKGKIGQLTNSQIAEVNSKLEYIFGLKSL